MRIKIEKLELVHPHSDFTSPHMRDCVLGHAAMDYLRACALASERTKKMGPLINFLLPTTHQTLELVTKAIAFKIDATFEPKKYSHRVHQLLQDYSPHVEIFVAMLSDQPTLDLMDGLEKTYLGVRYGECYVGYDGEVVQLFMTRAEELLDDLYSRTQVKSCPSTTTKRRNERSASLEYAC